MARSYPPASYGSQCGRSWGKTIEVDFYGYRRTLGPLSGALPRLGKQTGTEQTLLRDLRDKADALDETVDRLRSDNVVNRRDANSLHALVDGARTQLDGIEPIYAQWEDFDCIQGAGDDAKTRCPWPLSEYDHPSFWFKECAPNESHVGKLYQDDYGRVFSCPPPSIAAKREASRSEIRDLVVSALRWLRCAQYWATMAVVRDAARRAGWTDPTTTWGPGGSGPRPKPTPVHVAPGVDLRGAVKPIDPGDGPPPPKPPPPPPPPPQVPPGAQGWAPPEAPPEPPTPPPRWEPGGDGPEEPPDLPTPDASGLPPPQPGEAPPLDFGERVAAAAAGIPRWAKALALIGGGLLVLKGVSR